MSDSEPPTAPEIPGGVMDLSHCTSCGVKLDARSGACKINNLRYMCIVCARDPRAYWLRQRQENTEDG